jgi:hypothetical protein
VPPGKLSNLCPEISSESGSLLHSQTFPLETPLEIPSSGGENLDTKETQELEDLIS